MNKINLNNNKRLVVLSIDALENIDLEKLLKLPNFNALKNKISLVKNVREIYPTLTYPIHTTMITGKTPNEHGIFHNQKSDPLAQDFNIMGENWYWEKKHVKCDTLVDVAHKNNLNIASFCWPVTAGDKRGINVPEIWPIRGDNSKNYEMYNEMCSEYAFNKYYDSYLKQFDWKNNEDMVMYLPELAIDCIKTDKPDILLCHLILLDHIRHGFGEKHEIIDEILRIMDITVGRFIEASKLAGTYEDTNFIILGDHGQIDIENFFGINILLEKYGIIELGEDDKPDKYKAFGFSSGFSCNIIVKDSKDEDEIYEVLLKIKEEYPDYIERIYTRDEVLEEEGLAGNFAFVIEGTYGTVFDLRYTGDIIIPKDTKGFEKYKATHGYHPEKGEKPPLIAFGKDIKEGVIINNGNMLDVYPTLLKLININNADEIIKKENLKGKVLSIINE